MGDTVGRPGYNDIHPTVQRWPSMTITQVLHDCRPRHALAAYVAMPLLQTMDLHQLQVFSIVSGRPA